jgi:hypothetical protein
MYRIKAEYVIRVAVLERERTRLEAEAHALRSQLATLPEQGTFRSTDFEKARAYPSNCNPVLACWITRPIVRSSLQVSTDHFEARALRLSQVSAELKKVVCSLRAEVDRRAAVQRSLDCAEMRLATLEKSAASEKASRAADAQATRSLAEGQLSLRSYQAGKVVSVDQLVAGTATSSRKMVRSKTHEGKVRSRQHQQKGCRGETEEKKQEK